MPSLAQYRDGYIENWNKMRVLPHWQGAIDRAARYSLENKARYRAVEREVGVPWALIAAWHYRESSGDFRGVLHNGEHIIGTGRVTRLVPAGRGPFATWQEAAIDALKLKGLQRIKDWSPERICFESERFNGFGYRHPGRPESPYLWSGSNIYRGPGKFSSDGHYSPGLTDPQIGCLPHYRRILELDEEATIRRQVPGLDWLRRLRQGLKTGIGAITGLFTAENLGLLKEWFHGPDGALLSPENFILLLATVGAGWFLVNMADGVLANGHTPPDPAEVADGDVA